MLTMTRCPTPLGPITIACDAHALLGTWLEGQKALTHSGQADFEERPGAPLLKLAAAWLRAYFDGQRPAISDLPLAPAGSPFRQRVWKLLCAIPYGACVTYGELAEELATATSRMAAQAVGGAVGHNPLAIIIPCHRVMGAGGNLTGYGGGIEKKLWLLRWEGVDTRHFFMPGSAAGRRRPPRAKIASPKVRV